MKIPTRTRYRKRIGAFAPLDVSRDESVLSFNRAASCYNFDVSTGALKSGYGIVSSANVPSNALKYWVYRYYSDEAARYVDQYVYMLEGGVLRFYDSYTGEHRYLSGIKNKVADVLNYKLDSADVLIISCDTGMYVWNGKSLKLKTNAPDISSMALHFERLFVTSSTEPTKVFFSDDLDPTNWTIGSNAGGFIELLDERGMLTKVVSFQNYLYIFREHGISRVTAFGDQSSFSVTNLFVSAGTIYPESIVKCGSMIMFLASDGMYVFDGYDCKKTLAELTPMFKGAKASAGAYFDGKYYLSCRIDFDDGERVGCKNGEYENNVLLVYDTSTGYCSISRGLDISYLKTVTFCGEDFLMAHDSMGGGVIRRCGSRFGTPLRKHWRSPKSDFDSPDRTKALREIYIQTSADIKLGVQGKKTKSVAVKAGNRRIRFNASASEFALTIDSDAADCTVKPPTLIYTR